VAALVVFGLLPASAHAAVRPVQAFDQPAGFAPVWTPSALSAQPGDTIRWQFEQPGNANANGASHDLHLIRPGGPDEKLGVSYLNPVIEATVQDEGTYSFYCAIHRDSMVGEIAVKAGEATPVEDPGRPWETPAPPVVTDNGPRPLLNSASPLTVLETGDTVAPTLTLLKVSSKRREIRARVSVSEAGTLYARLLRGSRVVARTHAATGPGTASITLKRPTRAGRYRLAVWTEDAAHLESKWRYRTLRVRR
jgi:plastocyanin